MTLRPLAVAVCALGASLAAAPAPQVKLLWERLLADNHPIPHDVQGLRFSWDGQRIAAVLSHLRTEESAPNDLLIVPVTGDGEMKRVVIREELLSTPEHPGLHWSPNGEYLALETKHFSTILLHVADGERCMLPRTTVFGGFVGPDRLIAADWELPRDPAFLPARMSTVTTYGTDCKPIEKVSWRGHVRTIEPYPQAGLLAINPERADIRVLEFSKNAQIGHFPESSDSVLRFGDKGRVLCKADLPGRGMLACWDLRTGDRVVHPELVGGAPMDVSAESSVVVATESQMLTNLGAMRFKLHRWIVWDYRSRQELGRIPYKAPRHGFETSPAAVSPDGHYVAIGVGDLLRLYEVPRAGVESR
jgi:hypothetical protein